MLTVNDTLYTFTLHFEQSLKDEHIELDWVEAVMNNPERYELSDSSPYYIYEGHIEGHSEPLRVVVDEDADMLVTVYFVRPLPR